MPQGCSRVSALQWICVRAAYIGPRANAGQLPSPAALAAAAADARAVAAANPDQKPMITLPTAAPPAAIAPGPVAGAKLSRPGGSAAAAPAGRGDAALPDAWGAVIKAEPNEKVRMTSTASTLLWCRQ